MLSISVLAPSKHLGNRPEFQDEIPMSVIIFQFDLDHLSFSSVSRIHDACPFSQFLFGDFFALERPLNFICVFAIVSFCF